MNIRNISFFEEDITYRLASKQKIREWIAETISNEGYQKLGPLNFVFCSDEYLLTINKEYLDHDTYTDIVTFDSSEAEETIAGDIFISVERTSENAQKFDVTEWDEVCRVIIHGVLHLCGYGDKSKSQKKIMTEKENLYLSLRKV